MTCPSCARKERQFVKKAFIQHCQHNFVQISCVQMNAQQKGRKEKGECVSSVIHISEHATTNSEL
jgi:hypothetical protein